jgi:hypothetical protein
MPHSSYDGVLTDKDMKGLHPHIFHAEKRNALAIDKLLKLAHEEDIRVFWLLPPLSPNLRSAREQSGAELAYETFICGYLSKHPRTLSILDGRGAGYPATAFADATHLNARGAVALSRSVAREIACEADGTGDEVDSRWITLERWSEGSADWKGTLEDVETSMALISGGHPVGLRRAVSQ